MEQHIKLRTLRYGFESCWVYKTKDAYSVTARTGSIPPKIKFDS